MMTGFPEGNAIVYCQGAFATTNGKTAHGLVRRTKRYRIISVVDSRHNGSDAGEILDGRPSGIPIYGDVQEAVEKAALYEIPATHFVVGLAPDGGRLNSKGREDVKKAIELGLNVDCGLHDLLSDDEEIVHLAKKHIVKIRDIRKPPPRDKLHFFSGKIEEVQSLKIAVLGTDSAIGKRTTAWLLVEAFERTGLSVELIGTGQTAWMQGVQYGLILDALIVDFVTGEIEHAVWTAWEEKTPDVIIIEGQGSLLNPAYPGGIEILSAGRPDAIVLQHAPARKEYDGFPGYTLHSLDEQIRALEAVSKSKVTAITINHENTPREDIEKVCRQVSTKTGLPTADVLISGADSLIPHLTVFKERVHKKYKSYREKTFTASGKSLKHLIVFDSLEVGPVYIESDRIKVPYSVKREGMIDTFHLMYRYEEGVFDPDDPDSINLAHMTAVQVALNYGLFCNKIIFRGPYDENDRQFIHEMMENTACEIYVKKFLEQNQFLVGSFPRPSILRQKTYANAEIVFADAPYSGNRDQWNGQEQGCGILLSGGKESLLSYALLNEIGLETHPIFINESGRHWYTALNSFRNFRDKVTNTARVWTNSDRVYNWMLRHLPFIRGDFAVFRADDYPIRLWTVAVFLFGALPMLKKRQAGYLVIGDEYDTTRRVEFEGIPHYEGLYDQSSFFDSALTDYFSRKMWNIKQFSVVRPLSELLVQKILVERYAELQHHQVSCHMASIKGGRAFPCGRCEKCHRVVGMLKALGADPTLCGYTEDQVMKCLDHLPQKNLHQESASSQHMLYLLAKNGLIDARADYKENNEVMHLRFDSENSPPDIIPKNIRDKITKIQMEHASGALMKKEQKWVECNPLSS
jgi:uncharacterized NAD-dependent epimerase/dehydratase family protein/7-cyano-7-deazaguanine synthase in queuosine biosynthesis